METRVQMRTRTCRIDWSLAVLEKGQQWVDDNMEDTFYYLNCNWAWGYPEGAD